MTIRTTIVATCVAIGLLAIGSAHADPNLRGKAEAFAKGAGGNAVWTIDDKDRLHHVQSGVKCDVPAADDRIQLMDVHVYESAEVGGDVSCEYVHTDGDKKIYLTLYAFRPLGKSDQDWLDIAVASAKQVHPTWALDGKPEMTMTISDKDHKNELAPLTAAFSFKEGGIAMRSSVWVASTNGWVVQARATYRLDQKGPAEMLAIVFWAGVVDDIREKADAAK